MTDLASWVTTDRFEVTTPGEGFINPRCFGEDFANWLAPRLAAVGVPTSEPIQEDWGWALVADYVGYHFTISIGVMETSLGQIPADWRIGVAFEKPMNGFRSWFRPVPFESLQSLTSVVRTVLEAEPAFTVSLGEP